MRYPPLCTAVRSSSDRSATVQIRIFWAPPLVSGLARDTGLSRKRLIQLFTEEMGLTPKLFLRITRFQRLLADLNDLPSVDWASTAAEHGYFDQSHMIRDFHDFACMTPATYLARRGPAGHRTQARPPESLSAKGTLPNRPR